MIIITLNRCSYKLVDLTDKPCEVVRHHYRQSDHIDDKVVDSPYIPKPCKADHLATDRGQVSSSNPAELQSLQNRI